MILCDGLVDLRLGRWQDVLADVTSCDAVISDPPYGARTHAGHDAGSGVDSSGWAAARGLDDKRARRSQLSYAAWTPEDAATFALHWSAIARGWVVAFTSHDLVPSLSGALEDAGRYVFSPLPFVEYGSRPRLNGDGPASWTCWVVAARPRARAFMSWGHLPGAYVTHKAERKDVIGGKPLAEMRAIVRDYTRPGDLVVDPFCGGGTTALACAMEGRRCVTSEVDPKTHEIARARLAVGFVPDLFSGA